MEVVTVEYEHPKGNNTADDDAEYCCAEFEIQLDREPDDPNYGADADGNRGIFVAGGWYWEGEVPTKCEECGHEFTKEEMAQIEKAFDRAAENYSRNWEPLEPDEPYDIWSE